MSYDYTEAKDIFENGFTNANFDEIFAYARYSIHEEGNSERITEKNILRRLEEQGFSTVVLYDMIHKAVLWAKKPLSKETTVKITKSELEKIKDLREDYARVLFAALFLAKKDGNPDYYNRRIQEAISLSNVRTMKEGSQERNDFRYFLRDWLPMISRRNLSRRVLYSDVLSETIIEIDKKENPMKYYPRYCKNCGDMIFGKNKYCDKCSEEKISDSKKEYAKRKTLGV